MVYHRYEIYQVDLSQASIDVAKERLVMQGRAQGNLDLLSPVKFVRGSLLDVGKMLEDGASTLCIQTHHCFLRFVRLIT